MLDIDERLDLDAACERLTERQRWALLLVCYWGYSVAEAAATLGITRRAVFYRLHNASARLRDDLEQNLHLLGDSCVL